jgi:hypothetical protein
MMAKETVPAAGRRLCTPGSLGGSHPTVGTPYGFIRRCTFRARCVDFEYLSRFSI